MFLALARWSFKNQT